MGSVVLLKRLIYYGVIFSTIALIVIIMCRYGLFSKPSIPSTQLVESTLYSKILSTDNSLVNLVINLRLAELLLFYSLSILMITNIVKNKLFETITLSSSSILVFMVLFSDIWSNNPFHTMPKTLFGYFEQYVLAIILLVNYILFMIISLKASLRKRIDKKILLIYVLALLIIKWLSPTLENDLIILYIMLSFTPLILLTAGQVG